MSGRDKYSHVLETRERTHGSFQSNARLSQGLKALMRSEPGWAKLNETQRESLELISTKIARILGGNANFDDHWADVSGYATLIVEDLNGGHRRGTDGPLLPVRSAQFSMANPPPSWPNDEVEGSMRHISEALAGAMESE